MRLRVAGDVRVAVFFVAEGEEIVLGSREAVQSELEIRAGIGELGFDGANRCE
jgi:hypothetical protein